MIWPMDSVNQSRGKRNISTQISIARSNGDQGGEHSVNGWALEQGVTEEG